MEREDGEAQRAIKAGWRRFAAARTSWGKAGNTNFAGWAKLAQARRVCSIRFQRPVHQSRVTLTALTSVA